MAGQTGGVFANWQSRSHLQSSLLCQNGRDHYFEPCRPSAPATMGLYECLSSHAIRRSDPFHPYRAAIATRWPHPFDDGVCPLDVGAVSQQRRGRVARGCPTKPTSAYYLPVAWSPICGDAAACRPSQSPISNLSDRWRSRCQRGVGQGAC